MRTLRLELNLTLACNHGCPSCNRLCNHFPDRTAHVSPGQVRRFIDQVRVAKLDGLAVVKRLKVVGGEPLLNPHFAGIHNMLCGAIHDGLLGEVKVQSNGTVPIPAGLLEHPRCRIVQCGTARRKHVELVAPCDLGLQPRWRGDCWMLRRCGASLDAYGWLPCSAAIAIVGAFGLERIYRSDLPLEPWGLDELCRRCPTALPVEVEREHIKPFSVEHAMSASWAAAVNGWDGLPRKLPW